MHGVLLFYTSNVTYFMMVGVRMNIQLAKYHVICVTHYCVFLVGMHTLRETEEIGKLYAVQKLTVPDTKADSQAGTCVLLPQQL